MGQYYKGRKIGTCETMYYMGIEEARYLADFGEKDDDGITFKEYLEDGITRWRFPWPKEQHDKQTDIRMFSIPAGDIEIDHDDLCFHNTHITAGYGINIFVPCPHSKEFKDKGLRTSQGGLGEQWIIIKYEGMRPVSPGSKELTLKTIFSCARCDNEFRLHDYDVLKVKQRAIEHFELYKNQQNVYNYAMEVINRIK